MEINLFQILILLFIFYPLIKRLLDGMRSKNEQTGAEEAQTDSWGKPAEDERFSQSDRYGRSTPKEDTATYANRGQSDSQASGRPDAQTTARSSASSEPTWEDFFEGLESVLSGKEPEQQPASQQHSGGYRHPAHEPTSSSSGGSVRDSGRRARSQAATSARTSSPSTRKETNHSWRSDNIQDQSPVFQLDENDPIHRSLDEAPEVAVIGSNKGRRISHMLRDPERIRDGIVVREVLGPPISRRSAQHRH